MGFAAALGKKQQTSSVSRHESRVDIYRRRIGASEQKGIDNDIFDTVSEFAFVPYSRDPYSGEYTIAYDTFGYMVAKGAKI